MAHTNEEGLDEALAGLSLTRLELQRLNSNSYSRMILREAKRVLEQQRRENPLLVKALKLKRQKQR